jgi:hypothetical protein
MWWRDPSVAQFMNKTTMHRSTNYTKSIFQTPLRSLCRHIINLLSILLSLVNFVHNFHSEHFKNVHNMSGTPPLQISNCTAPILCQEGHKSVRLSQTTTFRQCLIVTGECWNLFTKTVLSMRKKRNVYSRSCQSGCIELYLMDSSTCALY